MKTEKRFAKKVFLSLLCLLCVVAVLAALGFVGYSAQAAMETEVIDPQPVPQASANTLGAAQGAANPLHNAVALTLVTLVGIVAVLLLSAVLSLLVRREAREVPVQLPVSGSHHPTGKKELLFDEIDWETIYRQQSPP